MVKATKNDPLPRTTLPASSPFVRLKTERDVRVLAGRTISQLRTGQIDYKIAQTIATLCNVALIAMRQGTDVALKLGAGKDNNYRVRRIVELEASPAAGDGPIGENKSPTLAGTGLQLDAVSR